MGIVGIEETVYKLHLKCMHIETEILRAELLTLKLFAWSRILCEKYMHISSGCIELFLQFPSMLGPTL